MNLKLLVLPLLAAVIPLMKQAVRIVVFRLWKNQVERAKAKLKTIREIKSASKN